MLNPSLVPSSNFGLAGLRGWLLVGLGGALWEQHLSRSAALG